MPQLVFLRKIPLYASLLLEYRDSAELSRPSWRPRVQAGKRSGIKLLPALKKKRGVVMGADMGDYSPGISWPPSPKNFLSLSRSLLPKRSKPTMRILSERRAGKYLADLYSASWAAQHSMSSIAPEFWIRLKPLLFFRRLPMNRAGSAASIITSTPQTQQIILYEGTVAGTSIFYNSESVKRKTSSALSGISLTGSGRVTSPCSSGLAPVFRVCFIHITIPVYFFFSF